MFFQTVKNQPSAPSASDLPGSWQLALFQLIKHGGSPSEAARRAGITTEDERALFELALKKYAGAGFFPEHAALVAQAAQADLKAALKGATYVSLGQERVLVGLPARRSKRLPPMQAAEVFRLHQVGELPQLLRSIAYDERANNSARKRLRSIPVVIAQ